VVDSIKREGPAVVAALKSSPRYHLYGKENPLQRMAGVGFLLPGRRTGIARICWELAAFRGRGVRGHAWLSLSTQRLGGS